VGSITVISGKIVHFGEGPGGGSTTAGLLYYLASDGEWELADADAVGTGASQLLAIAMGTDPMDDGMMVEGTIKLHNGYIANEPADAASSGLPLYVSNGTDGYIDFTAPTDSDTGHFVRVVGYSLKVNTTTSDGKVAGTLLRFNPDSTWVEIA